MSATYDLVVIGAGSGGFVGATFAARLGARVALVERDRIGGDCTWTGCVPSKALLRAARVAHEVRRAGDFGIEAGPPRTDMGKVAAGVRRAIEAVYREEDPAALSRLGIDVVAGAAEFVDGHTVRVGTRTIVARRVLICTGARPAVAPIPGLADLPFLTSERLFDNDRLPRHLIVLGAGPIGLEMALAYRRLGADVTVVGAQVLPREDPDVRVLVSANLEREGLRVIQANVSGARREGDDLVLVTSRGLVRGDMLLVATGRQPNVEGMALERAGIAHGPMGIAVDRHLRTSARHVYAAGDVTGGYQFTHVAGWQAFQAVRNALLPGRATVVARAVPWVTFLDPEVARVGLAEAAARARYGDDLIVLRRDMAHVDRAVADDETSGFVKVLARRDGRILGASIVAARAGEMIGEFALAMHHGLRLGDLGGTIHAYPTWATVLQQVTADAATDAFLRGASGRVALRLAGLHR